MRGSFREYEFIDGPVPLTRIAKGDTAEAFASASFVTAANGGLCLSPQAGRGKKVCYRLVSRQPAASASSTEQNQRVPLLIFISIFAYQRLVGW